MLRMFVPALGCLLMNCCQNASAASDKVSHANKPLCSAGAICFSGEVFAGKEFRRNINDQLGFVLVPAEPGWTIQVVPIGEDDYVAPLGANQCDELASVVTGPYRYHSALNIDMTYMTSAEEEVSGPPREFRFVTNCKDLRTESDRLKIVLWPYTFTKREVAKAQTQLGSSPLGKGRMWITDSKITHVSDTPDYKLGVIDWMRFTVEIRLPGLKTRHPSAAPQ
jgi:hypothetical protein